MLPISESFSSLAWKQTKFIYTAGNGRDFPFWIFNKGVQRIIKEQGR